MFHEIVRKARKKWERTPKKVEGSEETQNTRDDLVVQHSIHRENVAETLVSRHKRPARNGA